jgi:hypothetical protein
MTVPDLGQFLISLTEVFPRIVQLVFVGLGVFGLWATGSGLYALYNIVSGEYKFANRSVSYEGAFAKIALGGALIVAPVLLWVSANTFVAGGTTTQGLFGYGGSSGTYCNQIYYAVSYFFMALGAVAWGFAAVQFYDAAHGERGRTGSAMLYVVGGTLAFFVNDVADLVSNTTGMNVSLSNVCTIMGGS